MPCLFKRALVACILLFIVPLQAAPTATSQLKPFRILKHADSHSLALSPDGRYIASAATTDFPGPGEVRVWQMRDGKLLKVWKFEEGVDGIAFSPDSRNLAFTVDGPIRIYAVPSWKLKRKLTHRGYQLTGSVAFSPDGKTIVGGSDMAETGDVDSAYLWDARTGRVKRKLPHSDDLIYKIFFTRDGKRIVGAFSRGYNSEPNDGFRVWEAATGRFLKEQKIATLAPLALSPDSRTVATGSALNKASNRSEIRLWSAQNGAWQRTFASDFVASALDYSPDGTMRASGNAKGLVRLCDAKSGQVKQQFQAQPVTKRDIEVDNGPGVRDLKYAPGGKILVTTGANQLMFFRVK